MRYLGYVLIFICIIRIVPITEWFIKLARFIYWKMYDLQDLRKNGRKFDLYGLRLLTGKQGSGKSISLIYMLERYRKMYPRCKIATNFGYINQDYEFSNWEQLLQDEFKNGEDGLIIGWDEIQNDFSSTDFKNIPDGFLRQITQQRKQRVCILGTSQVFTRVLKALREQCFIVGDCKTMLGRWTRVKFYDAQDYDAVSDDPDKRRKLMKVGKISFIQNNAIRQLYDTYEVIRSMTKKEYIHPIDREQRRGA